MVKLVKVSAPGKIILSGEHSVVYGYPAIATAVNKRLSITKSGDIHSDIPIGAGMGSSAAFAVAMSALEIGKLDLEKINKAAYKMEKTLHGNPSGVDNTVVTYGGFLWYRKESESFKVFKQIKAKTKLPKLYLLNSGKPSESTREMVELVGRKYKKEKLKTTGIFKDIETVTKEMLRFLIGDSNPDLGKLISENERLLEKLGVVSNSARHLIRMIEKIGGFAKISGAGGKSSGAGMVLVYHKDVDNLSLFAKRNKINIMPVIVGEEGIKVEL
jgi:mevalonate kinase